MFTYKKLNNVTIRYISYILVIAMMMLTVPIIIFADTSNTDLPWLWPVPDSHNISALDIYSDGSEHYNGQAMDIDSNGYIGEERLDVVSSTNGSVFYIENRYNETDNKGSGFGNYVIIRYGDVNIIYAHLEKVLCSYGEIKAGDIIGKMGCTGNTDTVHLHIQAYPKNSTYLSTEIMIFDKYKLSPLDILEFQFSKSLTESKYYGQWISEHFSVENGAYLSYSEGLSEDYSLDKLNVSVMVINTSGAKVYSKPEKNSKNITDTKEFNSIIDIYGIYYDALGVRWLLADKINTDKWISADDVGFYDFGSTAEIYDLSMPENDYGSVHDIALSGILKSQNTIVAYTLSICKDGEELYSESKDINSSDAEIENLFITNENVPELSNGSYTIAVTVSESCRYPGAEDLITAAKIAESEFSIDESLRDTVPPQIFGIDAKNLTDKGLTVSSDVFDNKSVKHVVFTIDDGNSSKNYEAKLSGGTAYADIDFENMVFEDDTFDISVTANDNEGNTSNFSRTFTRPVNKSEVWKPKEVLNVRSGPGLSFSVLTTIRTGVSADITETAYSDGYTWGHYSKGWFALDLSEYVSGELYSVVFDLNGGVFDTEITPMSKRHGYSVEITSEIPSRENCKFLGWSFDSNSDVAEYLPASEYKDNVSRVLFAVWENTVAPEIVDVKKSSDTWTNQDVTVSVLVNETSVKLLYSFDGGNSWQSECEYICKDNTVFGAGDIVIRDDFGNTVSYDETIVIDYIDKVSPDVLKAEVSVTAAENGIIINFSDIYDNESGISNFVFYYSSDPQMINAESFDITDGCTVDIIENGVYYSYIKVFDNAGNEEVIKIDRFVVGAKTRLAVPSDIKVNNLSSSSAKINFVPDKNSDKTLIQISKSETFEEYFTLTVTEDSAIIDDLSKNITYYFRMYSLTSDGIYSPSDWSEINTFILTDEDDLIISSFERLKDAEIDNDKMTVNYESEFSAEILDLTVNIKENAFVLYYYDADCNDPIPSPSTFEFNSDECDVYIVITLQTGREVMYKLHIVRAAENASVPTVVSKPFDQNAFVNDVLKPICIEANTTDNGTLTVEWYCSHNGGEYVKVAEGMSFEPDNSKDGEFIYKAVIKNVNNKCNNKEVTVTAGPYKVDLSKRKSQITVLKSEKDYVGKNLRFAISGYDGDGNVSFRYYSDPACEIEIQEPAEPGTYYVVAYADETDEYFGAVSEPVEFVVCEAMPGDLDENGIADKNDAVYLLYYLMVPDNYHCNQNCDFDRNGIEDKEDIVYLIYHLFDAERYPI